MEYSIGDRLRIEGEVYTIKGKIKYKNRNDDLVWFEYKIVGDKNGKEKWLSHDEYYREYSISEVSNERLSTDDYHVVDRGVEEVIGAWGNVDVDNGERAGFVEYEDSTEEKIISSETWDDGEEISFGYYIDFDEIEVIKHSEKNNTNTYVKSKCNPLTVIVCVIIFTFVMGSAFMPVIVGSMKSKNAISKYLKDSANFESITSITGSDREKADVYKTEQSVDLAVKEIIDAIEGNTEDVQQNTEDGDNSVAILTKYEYCLVYVSEDNETLVQISSRKYAYNSNSSLYRSSYWTNRYYRRYYYSKGYSSDFSTYKNVSSPYNSFNDSAIDNTSYDSTYNTYSSSVRQSSVNSRSSSGGGTSSGK